MFVAYLRTFARMGLKAIPMRADTGPIGGDLSHEFQILAETGESAVYCDRRWLDTEILADEVDYDSDLEPLFRQWTALYAATDEMHDAAKCSVPEGELVSARGIEVGHIFYFGTKYSKPMGAVASLADGSSVPLEMGSYGIGVSRLVGALIEANHDDAGIIWPDSVAPFRLGLINLRAADAKCREAADELYAKLRGRGRGAVRRPRRIARRQIRDDGPDRRAVAADRRPHAGIAAGTLEVKKPAHRRAAGAAGRGGAQTEICG